MTTDNKWQTLCAPEGGSGGTAAVVVDNNTRNFPYTAAQVAHRQNVAGRSPQPESTSTDREASEPCFLDALENQAVGVV